MAGAGDSLTFRWVVSRAAWQPPWDLSPRARGSDAERQGREMDRCCFLLQNYEKTGQTPNEMTKKRLRTRVEKTAEQGARRETDKPRNLHLNVKKRKFANIPHHRRTGPKKTSNNYFPKKYLLIPKLLPNFVHACSRRPLRKQTPQEGGETREQNRNKK